MYYLPNPNLWIPPDQTRLLSVLMPAGQTEIATQTDYLMLLCQRLDWMIQRWMTDQAVSPKPVDRMLETVVTQLAPAQGTPSMTEPTSGQALPLVQWRQAWCQTLVVDNGIIQQHLNWQGIDFPQPHERNQERKAEALMMFNDTALLDPTLEDWLNELVQASAEA